jgi:hypothetical protein
MGGDIWLEHRLGTKPSQCLTLPGLPRREADYPRYDKILVHDLYYNEQRLGTQHAAASSLVPVPAIHTMASCTETHDTTHRVVKH